MADPHHQEALDAYDRFTVGAYRLGLFVAATGVAVCAAEQAGLTARGPGSVLVLVGVALIVAHMHLYAKTIRYAIVASGWCSAVGLVAAPAIGGLLEPWLVDAALGCAFVVFSGVALKERFCFRLPLLLAVPVVLATSLIPMRAGFGPVAAVLLGAGAAVMLLLAVAKVRMPLHFDIGDKRRYEV